MNQFKLVVGPFEQGIVDFCPRPARKDMNVPIHKRS